MFDIDIFSSISELDQEVWQQLNCNRPFSSPRWFRFLEKAFPNDRPIYILLYKETVPVAQSVLWVKADEPLPMTSSPLRKLTAAALRRWPLLLGYDPLVGGQCSLLLPADPTLHPAALETISRLAQKQLNQQEGSFLLYSYLEETQSRWSGWPADFVTLDFDEPETVLPLEWSTFEEYLDWLRQSHKSAYKDYRRHINRAAAAGIEVTVHNQVTAVDEALALVRATEQHHGSMPHPNARLVLEHMPLVGGRWLAACQNGRLVGSGLLLNDNGSWAMKFLGLDYNVRYVYFQLIYTAIQEVINAGGDRLVGGTGAYELKERLGFQPQNNTYIGFMSRSRLLRWLGRHLSGQSV
jgi:predicted N-acyltransferase